MVYYIISDKTAAITNFPKFLRDFIEGRDFNGVKTTFQVVVQRETRQVSGIRK